MTDRVWVTTRETEGREERAISDALYDVRATTTRGGRLAVVRYYAAILGWSQGETWAAIHRAAGSL